MVLFLLFILRKQLFMYAFLTWEKHPFFLSVSSIFKCENFNSEIFGFPLKLNWYWWTYSILYENRIMFDSEGRFLVYFKSSNSLKQRSTLLTLIILSAVDVRWWNRCIAVYVRVNCQTWPVTYVNYHCCSVAWLLRQNSLTVAGLLVIIVDSFDIWIRIYISQ